MKSSISIAVASPSFSNNEKLKKLLSKYFLDIKYNTTSKTLKDQELNIFLKDAEVAIIGLEKINEDSLKNCNSLKVISKYGVGLDNIDLNYCQRENIQLLFSKGVNRLSVAELVICYMIGARRNIFSSVIDMKNNIWYRDGGNNLTSSKIGIIGFGNIGQELFRLLTPFDCEFYINDVINFEDEFSIKQYSLDDVLINSDIITFHLPLNSTSRNLINSDNYKLIKPNTILINTSRSEIIDESIIYKLISELNVTFCTDVFPCEPYHDDKFLNHRNYLSTPHIGGNSVESILNMGKSAIYNIIDFYGIEKQ